MRLAALTLAAGLATAAASLAANATPVLPNPNDQGASNIIQVAQGCGHGLHRNWRGVCVARRSAHGAACGWGFHRNHWGFCVPNRPAYYGGGDHYPPHRSWYGY